jgi:hypothetical protein
VRKKKVPLSGLDSHPAVQRIAAVERTDQNALDDKAETGGQYGGDRQCAPKADIGRQRESEIRANCQKTPMGEIDHARKVEDQRQTERH